MNRLLDKVAIITGAGQGIGKGIARRFASEGAKTVIAEINAEIGNATATETAKDFGVQSVFVKTDAGDKDSIRAMVEQTVSTLGRVDILVNNAWAGLGYSRVEHMSDAHLANAGYNCASEGR